jgi:hypothetical protein
MTHDLEHDGFSVVPALLGESERSELLANLGPCSTAGRRGLLSLPSVAVLARSPRLLGVVRPHLRCGPVATRAILFDTPAAANWLVPGFGPWSVKDGIPHVQPPVEFLEQMLTVRLHLDDADESNGALRVLPRSHRLGRLTPEQVREMRGKQGEVCCTAAAGDALLMRPLLLHASSRSTNPRPRRVLHIEYAGFALPRELDWHETA